MFRQTMAGARMFHINIDELSGWQCSYACRYGGDNEENGNWTQKQHKNGFSNQEWNTFWMIKTARQHDIGPGIVKVSIELEICPKRPKYFAAAITTHPGEQEGWHIRDGVGMSVGRWHISGGTGGMGVHHAGWHVSGGGGTSVGGGTSWGWHIHGGLTCVLSWLMGGGLASMGIGVNHGETTGAPILLCAFFMAAK